MVMLLWIPSFALAASEQQTLLQTKLEVDVVRDENCKKLSATGDTCEICNAGYFTTPDGQCDTCGVADCEHCLESGGCQECSNGFHLSPITPAQCIPCKPDPDTVNDCQHCSIDPSKCDQCAAGLFLDLDVGSCTASPIPGCEFFKYVEGNVTCERCLDHYSKDIDGKCQKCDESNSHCRSCIDGAGICDKCDPGFFLKQDGNCVECEAKNCEQCDKGLGVCSACRVGFTFQDGLCVECQASGCHVCNSDRSTCDRCKVNFVLNIQNETAGTGTCCGPCPVGTGVEVCASNGQTYSNACEAKCANQSVTHQGQCSNDCADKTARVCGSDHKVYQNACKAKSEGVSIVCMSECFSNVQAEER